MHILPWVKAICSMRQAFTYLTEEPFLCGFFMCKMYVIIMDLAGG